jgi:hypothetical protein
MVVAVLTTALIHEFLPVEFRMTPQSFYLYPIFSAVPQVLIVGDPGRIHRERRWLPVTTTLMIGITITTAFSALRLVHGIHPRAFNQGCGAVRHRGRGVAHEHHRLLAVVPGPRRRRLGRASQARREYLPPSSSPR